MHEPTDLVELGTSDSATVDFSLLQPTFCVVVRKEDLPSVCKASCLGYFHAVSRQFGFFTHSATSEQVEICTQFQYFFGRFDESQFG